VLEHCFDARLLPRRAGDVTTGLPLQGSPGQGGRAPVALSDTPGRHLYGADAADVEALPGAGRELGWGLTEAMVRYAARHEYARTVEDVLARRSRLLFLDAGLAAQLAPEVARILHEELQREPALAEFQALAAAYAVTTPEQTTPKIPE